MTAATRQDALRQLLRGVADDLADYKELSVLLGAQFDAALRHQSAQLAELAERIGQLCATLETRRAQRQHLVALLLGPEARMAALFALLKGGTRGNLEAQWASLERSLRECQRLAKRNSDLLVDQYSLMQRVLHGEEQLYAPT